MRYLFVAIGSAFLTLACSSAAAQPGLAPALRAVPWTDSDGRTVRLTDLHAPLYVVSMAYTACRRVCGTTTLVLGEIQRRLEARAIDAQFVVVSYDPANDSPAQWREYRARRGLLRDNWHFLTGSESATRNIARHLDLNFWSYHDHIVHDFRIVLFDAQWRPVGEVDWEHIDSVDTVLRSLPLGSVAAPTPQ
jgi:cytochrome oxidase Cu insertion factor (SCO1/SenC/PrrC family)